jgi:hypothetical protein
MMVYARPDFPVAKERAQMGEEHDHKEHDHKEHDHKGHDEEAKGLDETAAKELIGHALRLLASEEVADEVTPGIEAGFELARHSSRAAGKETLSITEITVWPNGTDDEPNTTVFSHAQPVAAKGQRTPIAAGGGGPSAWGGGPTHGTNFYCVRDPKTGAAVCISWQQ